MFVFSIKYSNIFSLLDYLIMIYSSKFLIIILQFIQGNKITRPLTWEQYIWKEYIIFSHIFFTYTSFPILELTLPSCWIVLIYISSFSTFFLYLLTCSTSAGFTSFGQPPSVWFIPRDPVSNLSVLIYNLC